MPLGDCGCGGLGFGDLQADMACHPLDRGGLGVARASLLATFSYVASSSSSQELQDLLLTSAPHELPCLPATFLSARTGFRARMRPVREAQLIGDFSVSTCLD